MHDFPTEPLPDLTAPERAVRAAAFCFLLAEGEATVAAIGRETGLAQETTAAIVAQLDLRGAVTVDANGRISGSHGMSVVPAAYRLALPSGVRWVWCAEDAVGIPAALALDADVDGVCAVCGLSLPIRVRDGVPSAEAPVRVWLSEREEGVRPLDSL